MTEYLSIQGLSKCYGNVQALSNVDLQIDRGGVLALLGPNGAGKSTLFGCLLGLTVPTSGKILWHGRQLTAQDRARFGYVAERVSLYPHRTVLENATFFAQLKGHSPSDASLQLERLELQGLADRPAHQLSKGLLQRLGLAIALCGRPEVLVLDEPFNGLDPVLLERFQTILSEENQRGATLLISTHTISALEDLATHAAILLQGKLAAMNDIDSLRLEHGADQPLESIYHRIARETFDRTQVCA